MPLPKPSTRSSTPPSRPTDPPSGGRRLGRQADALVQRRVVHPHVLGVVRRCPGRAHVVRADAQDRHRSRHPVEHVAAVLSRERRLRTHPEQVGTEQGTRDVTRQFRPIVVVDRDRAARDDLAGTGAAVRRRGAVSDEVCGATAAAVDWPSATSGPSRVSASTILAWVSGSRRPVSGSAWIALRGSTVSSWRSRADYCGSGPMDARSVITRACRVV